MKCPRCDAELKSVDQNNIEIDICESCKGIWFDHGELAQVIGNADHYKDIIELSGKCMDIKGEEVSADNAISCPRCGVQMREYNYGYSSHILIDGCEKSKCGVWVDAGELHHITEYLNNYREELTPQQKEDRLDTLRQIAVEYEDWDKASLDSMVKMDDKGGIIMKFPGECLQFIYNIMDKIGL